MLPIGKQLGWYREVCFAPIWGEAFLFIVDMLGKDLNDEKVWIK